MTEMLRLKCFEGSCKEVERYQKEKRISKAAIADILIVNKDTYALWYWTVDVEK